MLVFTRNKSKERSVENAHQAPYKAEFCSPYREVHSETSIKNKRNIGRNHYIDLCNV